MISSDRLLARLWEKIVRPSARLMDVEQRRLARLLATLLAVIMPVVLLFNIPLLLERSYFSATFPIVGPAIALLAMAYWASRTRRFRWGAALTVITISGAAIISGQLNPAYHTVGPVTVGLSLMFAAIFFSLRQTVVIAIANWLALTFALILSPRQLNMTEMIATILLVAIMSVVIILWLEYRNQVEDERRADLVGSEARFRKLVETAPGAILLSDRQGKIVLVNEWVERMFGYQRAELVGQPVEILLPDKLHAAHVDYRLAFYDAPVTRPMGAGRDLTGRRKDGSLFPVEIGLSDTKTQDGMLTLALLADITERKQAQDSLRENREKLQTLFDLSPVGISLVAGSNTVLDVNPALQKILGLSEEDIYAGAYRSRRYLRGDGAPMRPEDFPSARALAEQRVIKDVEIGIVTETGETIWSSVSAAPTPDGTVVTVTADITERKRQEEALRYQTLLLENVTDAIISADFTGKILTWNKGAELIYGWRAEEAIGQDISDYLKTEYLNDETRATVAAQMVAEGRWRGELRQTRKDGSSVQVEVGATVIKDSSGKPLGTVTVNRDVTAEKELQQALQRSEANLRAILDNAALFYVLMDADKRVILVNRVAQLGAQAVFGRQIKPGDLFTEFLADWNMEDFERHFETAKLGGVGASERSFDTPLGPTRAFEFRYFPAVAPDGKVLGICMTSMDITERKQAEKNLRHQAALLRTMSDAVIETDLSSKIRSANPAVERIFGWRPDELIGKSAFILVADDTLPLLEERKKTVDTQGFWEGETLSKHRDGRVIPALLNVAVIKNAAGEPQGYVRVIKDITERKRVEDALRHSEAKIRAMIDSSPVPYALNDEDGNITYLNRAFTHTFGYDRNDIPTLADWWPKAYPDESYRQWAANAWEARLAESRKTGMAFEPLELKIRCKEGVARTALVSAALLGEAFTGDHLVILYDITERIQAEQQRAYQASLVEAIPDAVVSFDKDFNIISWNKAAEQMYGWSAADTRGHLMSEFVPTEYVNSTREGIRRQITETGSARSEGIQTSKSGARLSVLSSASLVRDGEGLPIGSVAVIRDITERKQSEIQLAYQASLIDNIPDAVVSYDRDYKIVSLNKAAERMYEWSLGEARGRLLSDIAPTEYINATREEILKKLAETGTWTGESIQISRSGRRIPVLGSASMVRNAAGEHIGMVAVIRDITERKLAEAAIVDSEALLTNIIDHFPGLISAKDLEGTVIMANRNFDLLDGPGSEGFVGKSVYDLFPRDVADALWANDLAAQRAGTALESEESVAHKDGSWHTYMTSKFPLYQGGKMNATCAISVDITRRKKAEDALRESEARYVAFIKHSYEGISRTEFENPIDISLPVETQIDMIYENAYMADCNQALVEMYQLPSVDAMIGMRLIDAHGTKDNPTNRAAFKKLIENNYISINDETIETDAMGKPIWFLSNTVGVVENGSLVRLWGTAINITERVQAEAALVDSETKYRHLVDNSLQGIVVFQNGRFAFANEAMSRITGHSVNDMVAMSNEQIANLVHADDRGWVGSHIRDRLAGLPVKPYNQHRIVRPDGGVRVVELLVSMTTYQGNPALQSSYIDITERVLAEQELERHRTHLEELVSQRTVELNAANEQLVKLGIAKDEFVSNVSHELRTPLANLKLRQYLVRSHPDALDKHLSVMERETERLRNIIEDLLQLSRLDQNQAEIKLATVNLNDLVSRYVSDRSVITDVKSLEVVFKGAARKPMAQVDVGLLEEALGILMTNATSYTPSGGRITVATARIKKNGRRWVGFSVANTGPGVPHDDQPRLFERFFRGQTGKQSGAAGTGLGLALAKQIVERHGGLIELASSGVPGEGARFDVWLPESPVK